MANITEILGTDSVSASRPVINTNFELLNDEIASIMAYLDPTTGILSGVINVTTQELNISAGGSSIATINSSGATFDVDTTFNGATIMDGKIIKSSAVCSTSTATTNNAPTSIAAANYFVNANFTIPAGDEGQEVTLFNIGSTSISVIAAAGVSLAATSIALDDANSSVTLRCFNNTWFVVGSHIATIS